MRQKKSKKSGQMEGFTFRREWAVQLEVLNECERSRVLKGMLMFYLYNMVADINGRAAFVYDRIISDIDTELGRNFNTSDNGTAGSNEV